MVDKKPRLEMEIVPYSSYDLHNEGLKKALTEFGKWAVVEQCDEDDSELFDAEKIAEGIREITNI